MRLLFLAKNLPSKKVFRNPTDNVKNKDLDLPIKKLHFLEGKYFVVIDKSIVQKLNFFQDEVSELYFQQEAAGDSCIILRPYKIGD